MDKLICLIVSTIVMGTAQMSLFIYLSEFRYDRRKVKRATVTVVAVTCALTIGISIPNNCDRTVFITLLGMSLPNIVFFFIVSKYRDVRFFTTYLIANASIALVDLFAYLFGLLAYDGNYTIDWIVRAAAIALWCIALHFLLGDRYRKALTLLNKGWSLMLLCAEFMYLLMTIIAAYPTPIDQRLEDVPLSMLMVTMMALTVIIVIRVIYNTLEVKEQRLRQQALQNRLSAAEKQYTLISDNIDEVRRLRHDMKYHMNVIQGLLDQQDYGALRQYLNDYHSQQTALNTDLPLYTQNQTVNILAAHFANRAQAEDIRTEFNIHLPAELPVDRTHLTGLLGNLWQNALEACMELPKDSDRFITTVIAIRQDKLMLQCLNSAASVLQDKDGHYISTKGPTRGSGLTSIEDIVSLYDGFCEFGFNGQVFSCSIVLPLLANEGGK